MLHRLQYEANVALVPSNLATAERRRRQRTHPDPRLILNRSQRLSYHLALRAGHTSLTEWLDPSIPFMFLFPGAPEADGFSTKLVGVPR